MSLDEEVLEAGPTRRRVRPSGWLTLAAVAAVAGIVVATLSARLDPTTLRVVQDSPIASQLGPGALVVGTTDHTLLVRSGVGGDELWCVDAQTGASRARFAAPGAVASGPDGAFELPTIALRPQRLDGSRCP